MINALLTKFNGDLNLKLCAIPLFQGSFLRPGYAALRSDRRGPEVETLKEHASVIIGTLSFLNVVGFGAVWKLIVSKLDTNDKKLDKALEAHHECQKQLSDRYLSKPDFERLWAQFLATRQADHSMINNRLHSLETQQANLISKIDLFMDDSTKKVERLSNTFIAKEAEISKRIDNIADKINHRG